MKFQLIIDPEQEESVVAVLHEEGVLSRQLEQLLSGTERLTAYAKADVVLLDPARVECVTVSGGKTWAIDDQGRKFRLRARLYEVEKLLPASFFRINKSTLANEAYLTRFSASFSGGVDAVFQSGYTDYVSRRCFAQLKRRFEVK